MYRSKDFTLMDVVDVRGKRLGYIKDLLIDFNRKKVIGFNLASISLFKKDLNIMMDNIVGYNLTMVVTDITKGTFFQFSSIKGMDIRDRKGNIIGMVEDMLFDEKDFAIKALVVSTGFINNFVQGKKVVLINNLILGEESLLFNGRKDNLNFSTMPHKLFMEDSEDEKDKKINSI